MLFNLVLVIKEKLGITIELVNLGGGFGIPYRPEEKVIDVQAAHGHPAPVLMDQYQVRSVSCKRISGGDITYIYNYIYTYVYTYMCVCVLRCIKIIEYIPYISNKELTCLIYTYDTYG